MGQIPTFFHQVGCRGHGAPTRFVPRLGIGISENAHAVPWALGAGLASGMGELHGGRRAMLLQELGNRVQGAM